MSAHTLAEKMRSGIKNRRGAKFSYDQLIELRKYGILKDLAIIESEEICPEKHPLISSVITGSTNAEMVSRQTSGKSPLTSRERAQLSISALSAGL
jgi:hypothetical protein